MEKHRVVTACVSTFCSILLNAPIRDIDHRLIEASNAINLTNAHPTPQSIECLLPSSSGVRLFVGEFGQYGRAMVFNPNSKSQLPIKQKHKQQKGLSSSKLHVFGIELTNRALYATPRDEDIILELIRRKQNPVL